VPWPLDPVLLWKLQSSGENNTVKRSYDHEIMDDLSIRDARFTDALDELRVINTFLLGYHASYRAVTMLESGSGQLANTMLDVGGGGSTFPAKFNRFTITSVDINPAAGIYTRQKNPNVTPLCADAFHLPFKDNAFDIVHASLFIHHFNEEDIGRLLREFLRVSSLGVIINDPLRSRISLAGITLLTRLFSRSEMVRHDAPLSVRRGLTLSEMKTICRQNGIIRFSVYHAPLFRLMAIIPKSDNRNL